MIFNFSNKAQTLEILFNRLNKAQVLPLFRFSVEAFRNDSKKIIADIQEKFKDEELIVRSSAFNEDCFDQSNAGHYLSILNVSTHKADEINAAIRNVIASYDKPDLRDEVFIQPMLMNIACSGVAFTSDIDTLAPYYIVNFDESSKTDTVTGGRNGAFRTYIQIKDSPYKCLDNRIALLIEVLKELEQLFNFPHIDVEFSFDSNEILYIFQVRPLATKGKESLSDLNLKECLFKISKKIEKITEKHPRLLGSRTVFGVMPDWNPAEIIGLKPKQLALTLYKELITDNIWAYQRDNYGYRNLRSHPLMMSLMGVPFIDVRVDFNSFIPKGIEDKLADKLVDYYINRLISTPSFHDKIEFEIIYSCYFFDLPQRLKTLLDYGFSENETRRIEFALLELTNKIICPDFGFYKTDIEKIELLKRKYEEIVASNLSLVDKIYWLVEDCKRFGTLPFAGIARAAFIATQILRSLIKVRVITEDEYNLFLNSLKTINKILSHDIYKFTKREISLEEFLEKYGHLRPGTYDINSQRYDENFENYFSETVYFQENESSFSFSDLQKDTIQNLITENGLKISTDGLLEFIRKAIEGREYAKFIFTKSLSKVLQYIDEFGSNAGIAREDMAYVDIHTIMNLYSTLNHQDVREIFEKDIIKNKNSHNYTKAIKLPSLIVSLEDVYGFFLLPEEPNFITNKRIIAKVLKEDRFSEEEFKGKIVFIRSADPGYDFLFTKNISGLITQFGGANSHMAVRSAEMGIPAVIGCGEKNFTDWMKASILEIDCANKLIRIIS